MRHTLIKERIRIWTNVFKKIIFGPRTQNSYHEAKMPVMVGIAGYQETKRIGRFPATAGTSDTLEPDRTENFTDQKDDPMKHKKKNKKTNPIREGLVRQTISNSSNISNSTSLATSLTPELDNKPLARKLLQLLQENSDAMMRGAGIVVPNKYVKKPGLTDEELNEIKVRPII